MDEGDPRGLKCPVYELLFYVVIIVILGVRGALTVILSKIIFLLGIINSMISEI